MFWWAVVYSSGQSTDVVTHLVMYQPLQIPGLLCLQYFITDSLSGLCCSDVDALPF